MTSPTQKPETEQQPLTDIHEALTEAIHESKNEKPMVNFSARMREDTKAEAMRICEANGTDLSTYLRKCAEALVKDYK